MTIIHVENLKKSFQSNEVIKGISFGLEEGQCIALLGANGAGKTTILKMLSGLMKQSSGKIIFDGIQKGDDLRKYIGYLPQFPVFYEWMTGREFLEHVGKLAGLPGKEAKERTVELLELVGILEAKNRRIGKYSGGMKQRLGIAQAIIHKPKLVMLDEPVSALDPFGRREVLQLIEKLKKETTVLFSTHILNDAEEVCDEIMFLHKGEIVESGTMEELRSKHQQASIDIVLQDKAEKFMDQFKDHHLIQSYTIDGNRCSVIVTNIEEAKQAFLKEIIVNNWPLIKFELSRTSLEDVFMKVVQK
ncbi:ABC transporter ATP-binding protein [Bacillus massilinigeriensis]|uniref:ABC transporter ATP-binding protein n=1 Tax=Bacillus massilionigeriensis TaxID=1805475 RepID=UPI00096B460D|nr:ABC transporter ATP-binding protein [Bacillus massilionigeriensis]